MTAENFAVRLKQANLATKTDTDDFVKKANFDDKLKNLDKKVQIKQHHAEVEKKITNSTNKLQKYQKKDLIFC